MDKIGVILSPRLFDLFEISRIEPSTTRTKRRSFASRIDFPEIVTKPQLRLAAPGFLNS